MNDNEIVTVHYATAEEKYKELRRLTLEQIQKGHPDINGNTEANARTTRKWIRQLKVFEKAFAKFKEQNK